MAFDPKPSTWLPNWSEDGTNITVPIATFPNLTAGMSHATTGDIRKVLYHFLEKLWTFWNGLALGDRPGKLTILKSSQFNQGTGQIVNTYSITVVLDVGSTEVTAES